MGRTIDPRNPLYGGAPEPVHSVPVVEAAAPAAEPPKAPEAGVQTAELPGASLDFSTEMPDLDVNLKAPAPEEGPRTEELAPAETKQDMDFDISGFDLKGPENKPGAAPAAAGMDFSGLDLDLGSLGGEDEFDEVATKLDLARAYLEMGDKEGAREILQEVINEGNDTQKSDARGIMDSL